MRVYKRLSLQNNIVDFNTLQNHKAISVDLETTGLNPRLDSIVGLAFAVDDTNGYYLADDETIAIFCKEVLSNAKINKIFHNAIFDISFLRQKGFVVNGDVYDTMVLAHLLDPDREELGLKFLSSEYISPDATEGDSELTEWLQNNSLAKADLHRAPLEILTKYAAEDAINTFTLFKIFYGKLQTIREWLHAKGFEKTPWEYYREEYMPLFDVLVSLHLRGVKLDLERTSAQKLQLAERLTTLKRELSAENRKQIEKVEEILHEKIITERKKKNKTGELKKLPARPQFNWDSNDHLKTFFYDVCGQTPSKKTHKGNTSIDVHVLETLVPTYPWVEKLIEYKELNKLVNTYLDKLLTLQDGGVIHAQFNIIGTATGRFSCARPNLQNLPKHGGIKTLFVPRQGNTFIYADYSQLELRIAAHLSKDATLIRAFREDIDLHAETARTIGCTRDEGKRLNFAIIYNAGGWRIAEILGYMNGLPLCTKAIRDWKCACAGCVGRRSAMKKGDAIRAKLFGKYTGLAEYVSKQMEHMEKYGFAISPLGRIRRLPNVNPEAPKAKRNHDLKAGFNLPIQSFGASLCKRAMTKLHEAGLVVVNQIHDSILVEVGVRDVISDMAEVKRIMENIYPLDVPLVVEPKIITSFEEKEV